MPGVSAQAGVAPRNALGPDTLLSGSYRQEVDLSAYAPAADAQPATAHFEGRLRLRGVPRVRTLRADEQYLDAQQIAAAGMFPADFDYAFVQDGEALLPVRRGFIPTTHAYWDIVLEPGRVWQEPGDAGYARAAIPFALVQKQMNCTHNGVLTFLFRDDGAISRAAMQISSETCSYLQFDMWGLLDAAYQPEAVSTKAAVIAAYRSEVARRLPQRPIAGLGVDHPGVAPAKLAIGAAAARTLYGFVADGVHYVSACRTRRGDYPYCEVLDIPSFSLAKSMLAGVALMRMEALYPGTRQVMMTDHAPAAACGTAAWAGVTLQHLLDMSSGHDDATGYMADEDAGKVAGFFSAEGAAAKATFSCAAYPRKVAPAVRWVYRSSDTFLLGATLAGYLRSLPRHGGDDFFDDVVVADVYAPLGLSATARVSRRTDDAAALPLSGYGLELHRDDIARMALFLGVDRGRIDGRQVLDGAMLDAAMQRNPAARGLPTAGLRHYRYQHGFWARNVKPVLGCAHDTWVPFMSGFGGISVVMFPNGTVFYNVVDDGELASFDWRDVAIEARKFGDFCQ